MKIAILSHRGGNIGHDFMAAGIEVILREAFGREAALTHFEQHRHFSVYPRYHPLRLIDSTSHGRLLWMRDVLASERARAQLFPQTLPLDFNLAIAAGGPNVVPGGGRSPAMRLMLLHLNGAFRYHGIPLVDAGVGACFPLEKGKYELTDPIDRNFYAEAANLTSAIITREPVAQRVYADLGFPTEVIPCAAIACGRAMEEIPVNVEADGYVVINFQKLGANEDWGQGVDPARWRETMRKVIAQLERRKPVILLAHSARESGLAAELAPHLPCVYPKSISEYASAIAGACVGIVSRIHAAIPMAGMGIPSIVIGTDTRLKTVEAIGLKTVYVKNATSEFLVDASMQLIDKKRQERHRLISLRDETIMRYADLFRRYAA